MAADNGVEIAEGSLIAVEVVYALPDRQRLIALAVEAGCTARQAVRCSGIAVEFPGLDIEGATLGIFGRVVSDETRLAAGDRVEIYRPLLIDPKAVRRARAERKA